MQGSTGRGLLHEIGPISFLQALPRLPQKHISSLPDLAASCNPFLETFGVLGRHSVSFPKTMKSIQENGRIGY
jgi:hypothetical protein